MNRIRDRAPPPKSGFQTLHTLNNPGGRWNRGRRRRARSMWGRRDQSPTGRSRRDRSPPGRSRRDPWQRRRERRREVTLEGQRRREVTLERSMLRPWKCQLPAPTPGWLSLAWQARREQTLAWQARREQTLAWQARREQTLAWQARREQTLAWQARREQTLAWQARREQTLAWQALKLRFFHVLIKTQLFNKTIKHISGILSFVCYKETLHIRLAQVCGDTHAVSAFSATPSSESSVNLGKLRDGSFGSCWVLGNPRQTSTVGWTAHSFFFLSWTCYFGCTSCIINPKLKLDSVRLVNRLDRLVPKNRLKRTICSRT